MKIYIAANINKAEDNLDIIAKRLADIGHQLIYDDLATPDEISTNHAPTYARNMINRIANCDLFVLLLNEDMTALHIQTGVAIANNIPIYAIGSEELVHKSIFYFLSSVKKRTSINTMIDELEKEKKILENKVNQSYSKIIQNGYETKQSKKIYLSTHVHDYVTFKVGKEEFMIDGGLDYCRRGASNLDNFKTKLNDLCLTDKSNDDVLRDRLCWGTRGRTGTEPLKYIRIKNMDVGHLKAVILYDQKVPVSPVHLKVMKYWLDQKNESK